MVKNGKTWRPNRTQIVHDPKIGQTPGPDHKLISKPSSQGFYHTTAAIAVSVGRDGAGDDRRGAIAAAGKRVSFAKVDRLRPML
jgi:hypothetical protein